jgi:hypothetical protein
MWRGAPVGERLDRHVGERRCRHNGRMRQPRFWLAMQIVIVICVVISGVIVLIKL